MDHNMKKLLAILIASSALLASCKNEAKEKEVATQNTSAVQNTTAQEERMFSTPEAEDYKNFMEALVYEYKTAAETKNSAAMEKLSRLTGELAQKSEAAIKSLSGEELSKLQKFIEEKNKEIETIKASVGK